MVELAVNVIVWTMLVIRGSVALSGYLLNRRFIKYLKEEIAQRVARGQNGDQSLVLETDIRLLRFVGLALTTMWLTALIRFILVPFWWFGVGGFERPTFDVGDTIGSSVVLYFTYRAYRVVYAKLEERRGLARAAEGLEL